MEVVRNLINVSGLADPHDLPEKFEGQIVEYSETETIVIPEDQPDMKNIFQAIIKVEKKSARSIRTAAGRIMVIDGVKKLKILCMQDGNSNKANFLDLDLPYNTFIELREPISLDNIAIYVLDAYFSLLNKRCIYSHLVFLIYVPASLPGQDYRHSEEADSFSPERDKDWNFNTHEEDRKRNGDTDFYEQDQKHDGEIVQHKQEYSRDTGFSHRPFRQSVGELQPNKSHQRFDIDLDPDKTVEEESEDLADIIENEAEAQGSSFSYRKASDGRLRDDEPEILINVDDEYL